MAHLFKKYEFDSQAKAQEKIDALPHSQDEEGNSFPSHQHTIVKLGFIAIQEATYDEQGEELTPAVLSDKYSVDVLWSDLDESPYGWKSYEISIEGNGVHTFAGWSFN
jgi:hypothetical protein